MSVGERDLASRDPSAVPATGRVSSQTTVERVLRWNIGTGVWRPGDAIPSERALARELGVGRSTLRSAINVLRAEGMLVTSLGRNGRTRIAEPAASPDGTVLQPSARQDIYCHFELRAAVEPAAAELAAARGTTQDFDRLRDILHQPVSSVRSYHALESQFHIAVADACGNPLMTKVVAELCAESFTWAEGLARAGDDRLPAVYRDFALTHKAIYERLMTRDAAGARDAVRNRLIEARDFYLRQFDDRAGH
jgi:GntR family transcriptional regulator, transcriptional repressor for pyruvate dehydrogenase complex